MNRDPYTKKTLIIVGGGILQVPLIRTAQKMGLFTIVFDMNPKAPGMQIADHHVIISTKDIEGCVREAKKISRLRKINGVITAGTDASKSVAAIANALELPGIRYASAEAATNKVLMRKILKENHIPVPDFASIWSFQELKKAIEIIGFPAVLKPSENMGARGVIKITKKQELNFAYHHSKMYSPTGELILEEYLDGKELSIDALAWNGNYQITGIADRIIVGEPYFLEIGHNMPSSLPKTILEEASQLMIAAMKVLGIHHGAGKGDIKITPKGIFIGEIAARLSGGFMSSHTYPLSSGVNLYQNAIKIALGEEPKPIQENFQGIAIERGILSSPGKIISIEGIQEALHIKGIEDIIITRKPGDILKKPTSNIDKIGHIIAKGKTLEEAIQSVEKAKQMIRIHIDEQEGIDWKEVEETARRKFSKDVCWVCKICDGKNCASGVPGMGGAGNQFSFIDNIRALEEYKIIPSYIHKDVDPDISLEIFGRKIDIPIMIAPMTGATTNLKNAISEEEMTEIFLQSGNLENTITWVGDGASPDKYQLIFSTIEKFYTNTIAILKPRAKTQEIIKRIQKAEEMGLTAIGIDIDAIQFKTLTLHNEKGKARDIEELKEIRQSTSLPFILKGIINVYDAIQAIEMGADAIVVSNHGGRISDSIPGTARVLPEIAQEVKGKITILVDGGIRSGSDIFKMLCLGADGVLIGRPFLIAAVGGGIKAVRYLFHQYKKELIQIMKLCGLEKISDANFRFIKNISQNVFGSAWHRK